MSKVDLSIIVEPLQDWFKQNARKLPWRETVTPYRVWVSEIMLQQTRVEAVIPYFERFLQQLPDIRALAYCNEERLLKLWEGLGYYNRVRNMKIAANQILEEWDGEFPHNYEDIMKLKGIGSYTAGAIASIAFSLPAPAVDGNVLRVLARITGDTSDIAKAGTKKKLEEQLAQLMTESKTLIPGVFNQSLMELGATVCIPNGAPLCEKCPLKQMCVVQKEGNWDVIPHKTKLKARKKENLTVFVIRTGDEVVIAKRKNSGLLAGLYELPNTKGYLSKAQAISYVEEHGLNPLRVTKLPDAKHIFSHVEWHMKGYLIQVEDMEFEKRIQKGEWIVLNIEEVERDYAIPSAFLAYVEYINLKIGKQGIE